MSISTDEQREDLVLGLKRNEGKPMVTLVHPQMVMGLARVFEFGLKKYSRNSWQNFTPEQAASCLPDAGIRHIYRWLEGERIDPETGCHHLLQAAWNLLVMWWVETFRKDDAHELPEVQHPHAARQSD